MATKLKNLHLTSVDLVRAGANQEADICLHKSADGEAAPTDQEAGIFKRVLNWLFETHGQEETVEKDASTFAQINGNRENRDKLWRYTDALTCSFSSIQEDNDLSGADKARMMNESLQQFTAAMVSLIDELCYTSAAETAGPTAIVGKSDPNRFDEIVEIEKHNPYHGKDGRFASANGAASFGYAPGKGQAASASGATPIKVNGPKESKEYADRYIAEHPEVAKDVEKYKNVLRDVQNFQKDHPGAEDGTYSAVTGELVNPTGGFAVTFHQNLTKDNPYGGYDSDTYAKMCAVAKHQLGSEDVYIGFFGNAEVSFNCASKEQAMKFATEHNQHSIFDCTTFEVIVNKRYNPSTNPIEGHE